MGVYHMDYWDCMEHHEDGSPNPEGKKRRQSCKAILLGIMYGRGANAIAEQIGSDKATAQKIIDDFYTSFPQVKTWMDESLTMLRETGEVTDFYGRKRHLPDIKLPPYVITYVDPTKAQLNSEGFNPFLECNNRTDNDNIIKYYSEKVSKIKYNKDYELLKAEALKYGVNIQANTGKIAQAERQCVNARIQGGAATMTKIAMNKLYRDQELKDLGFKLLIGVHDELIGECPKENADKVADKLTSIMKTCVEDIVDVPFKCDASVCDAWYYDELSYSLQEKFSDYRNMGMTEDEAIRQLQRDHCELLPEQISQMLVFK